MGHLRTVHTPYRLLHEKHVSPSFHLEALIVNHNSRFKYTFTWLQLHLQSELGVLEDRWWSVRQRVRVPMQDQTFDHYGNHTDDHLRFERGICPQQRSSGQHHTTGAASSPLDKWIYTNLFLIPNLLMFRKLYFLLFFSN